MEDKVLQEFFAVTMTSVYRVGAIKNEHRQPTVEKIALRGGSVIGIGSQLTGGSVVGITKLGILLYQQDYDPFSGRKRLQRPEEVNTTYWGGMTSSIVALFLDRDEALACFNELADCICLTNCDPQWQEKTEAVLMAIGNGHPVFIISADPKLAISYQK